MKNQNIEQIKSLLEGLYLKDKVNTAEDAKTINKLLVLIKDPNQEVQLSVINNPNADLQVITKCIWNTEHHEVLFKAISLLKEKYPKESDDALSILNVINKDNSMKITNNNKTKKRR